ncbi:hypothetical protein A2291_03110 [candidate division WOR-1 bacterium RIFOXYB2_FULL_42_35]|uniref:Transposase IS200-like domain-containing protein n=1 Tax=candidate division WOR-1 bacterium RIFOXYC2_FULL_41_25 TaxID=1802586 RepID=A0A1F4TII7_UNCSA|nr:MAG: hypothetical protein A2247_02185 [candidate division WOR-1 bacterium RIFOXYA2_FULL_41_14]OGC21550.1 MAG: hypothetical protein A2291_03110 [candidate division WOR-1 bacterium RIFOXYB2_FULL_42_35]OGC32528.1 MAG: hypothetical protein A2462_02820 [candidate division WOR-1 bacterium RIFOXYC2_FULL_41_25]
MTICTYNRVGYFGAVADGKMKLSPIGEIVWDEWYKTEQVRPNVKLDGFVVMPNHLHGIIMITNRMETKMVEPNLVEKNMVEPDLVETNLGMVESNMGLVESPRRGDSTEEKIKSTEEKLKSTTLKPNSLGSIICQFKSICTKRIWAAGFNDFAWQSRFYEHIIRDDGSLNRIRQDIANNPIKWELDRNNPGQVVLVNKKRDNNIIKEDIEVTKI